jgi:cytochrome c-type biogenesis protein CcmH/NrfG
MGDVSMSTSAARPASARKRRVDRPAPAATPLPVDPDLLAAYEDQRRFLRQSLRDLDRELEAGDLDRDDYDGLKADYEERLRSVDAAISEGKTALAAAKRPRSLWRTAAVVAGVAVVAVGLGVLVANFAGRRSPGDTITGNDPRTEARSQLLECLDLDRRAQGGEVKVGAAFQCYDELYNRDREDPVVLANFGWFLYRAGSSSGQAELLQAGPAFIDEAIQFDPDYPDAHAYRLIILTREGRIDEARAELAALEALNPPPEIRELLEPIRQQLAEAPAG